MNIEDLPDDSESSDEDYVPEGANTELLSEEESDGDVEDLLPESEELGKRGTKRQKNTKRPKKKSKTTQDHSPIKRSSEKNYIQEEKPKIDDLWAEFKKDTGFKSRTERIQPNEDLTVEIQSNKIESTSKIEPQSKVKVTQIFKFAGEEVKVEKEVTSDSSNASSSDTSKKKSAGRISSLLNQIGKKSKINTLEKSKLDWEKFKKDEDIQDELSAYRKSKDGFLERQDFLERADLRRFEIEKDIRSSLRNNRMNNVNM